MPEVACLQDPWPTPSLSTSMSTAPDWINVSLSRKLLLMLAAIMTFSSLVFLTIFIWFYQSKLQTERANASMQINLLLQASLENAMLKRDIPGLRGILKRLGHQANIQRAMIINPQRRIRFSSDQSLLNKSISLRELIGCKNCETNLATFNRSSTKFAITIEGQNVLRTVNPIHNKKPCTVCHGDLTKNPINGLLIVDYDASGIRTQALHGALTMSGAGAMVMAIALAATWWFLKRAVVTPVKLLTKASQELRLGNLNSTVSLRSKDELYELGKGFNSMAKRLGQSLEELSAHERYLQSIVDAVPDGIRVIDANYRITLANEAYCRQHKREMTEVLGQFCYAQSHGRDSPCPDTLMTCPLRRVTQTDRSVKVVHHHYKSDGRMFQAEVIAAPLKINRDGATQASIVEAIRDLEQQASVTQEQRLAELGQLAAGVAHEIHNPLASVRLALQALLRQTDRKNFRQEVKNYIGQVEGEIDKCIEVNKRLLNLASPPSKHTQIVPLDIIIPEVLSLLKFEAEKQNANVALDLDRDLRVLATDSEMRMLTLNIVQNAFHAMPEGGKLLITGRKHDGEIIITFEDSGVGIDSDELAQIFDPFFSRRADIKGGTGLGLTICKTIVDRHQGHIEVVSAINLGTRFLIRFPAADSV